MTNEAKRVITIDGGAQTGKSTAARRLAEWLGWRWVSTGAFYRGLACVADRCGVSVSDEAALAELIRSGEFRVELTTDATRFAHRGADLTAEIFSARVGELTPLVSRWPKVRAGLLEAQRELALIGAGLIAEGRDCGTVVFPEAPLKFYFEVSDEAAAKRFARSHSEPYELALEHVRERNRRDATRATAQMKPASDAVRFDTSESDPDQVVEWLKGQCRARGIARVV